MGQHPLNNNTHSLARVKNMSFTAQHHVYGNSDSSDKSNEGEKTTRGIIQSVLFNLR